MNNSSATARVHQLATTERGKPWLIRDL